MANILNADLWDWVDPETSKVTRLRRGDEVPDRIISFTEDGGKSMFEGWRPVLTKSENEPLTESETGATTAASYQKSSGTSSAKGAESDKK